MNRRRILAASCGLLVLASAVALAVGPAPAPHAAAPIALTAPSTTVDTAPSSTPRAVMTPTHPGAAVVAPADAHTHVAPPPTSSTESGSHPEGNCAQALAYLAAHEAPGYHSVCPANVPNGWAALTCVNTPGECPGEHVILIAGAYAWCRAAWMNEASNSWYFYRHTTHGVQLPGQNSSIDPYGRC